ncbi:hypothetical protein JCM14635_01020 [Megalodesulfovibrio paquesii]
MRGTFVLTILLGASLLRLPQAITQASTQAQISWVDALFTATAAVCVTGLAVVDMAACSRALASWCSWA